MELLFEVRRYREQEHQHSHDFHQLILALEGRLGLLVDAINGSVELGTIALVPAGVMHRFQGSATNEFLVLDLPVDSDIASDGNFEHLLAHAERQPFFSVEPETSDYIGYLATLAQRGQLRRSNLRHACALLFSTIAAELNLDHSGSLPRSLCAVIGYVDAHLEWQFSVADLCKVGHVSQSRLFALFSQHLSTSPGKFVNERRVLRAAELLASTSLTIAEIAVRTGFSDQSAFSKSFRKRHGAAPREYRRDYQA